MLVKLIKMEFLEHFAQLLGFKSARIKNTLLFNFSQNVLVDIGRNFRAFLCLKLSQPLIEMIDLLIGEIGDFTGRIFV